MRHAAEQAFDELEMAALVQAVQQAGQVERDAGGLTVGRLERGHGSKQLETELPQAAGIRGAGTCAIRHQRCQ
ncbi:MAG: hypothetical protein GWN54_05985 [Gammaproteobacteria bacterium]|nr:hypothetical protein [Gammaproteobacteria bacterium]